MAPRPVQCRRIAPQRIACLESLYAQYNHRRFVSPDPLEVLFDYHDPGDREIAGLVSACLAFGNVQYILRSVRSVLGLMGPPRSFLDANDRADFRARFDGFQHRYVREPELTALLVGIKTLIAGHGSLGRAFADRMNDADETVLPALTGFVDDLRIAGGGFGNYLLPDPAKGSACKRLHLYLRWMVRSDNVDPGGWAGVPASKLIVPVDTHMHRIAKSLGLTKRKQANLATALDITASFRRIAPDDPVRYDFALTRLGIRRDSDWEGFLAQWRRAGRRAA